MIREYASQYEYWLDRAENAYARKIKGKTCRDCKCCLKDYSVSVDIGYCRENECLVGLGWSVEKEECDAYD